MALSCVSCGSTRSVTLRVTDDAGAPVPYARIRAASLNTSDVPLPVTWQRISEALSKPTLNATTNSRGEARISVHANYAQTVEVIPPLGDAALCEAAQDQGLEWHWFLDLKPLTVNAPSDRPNPPGLKLEAVR